MSRIARNAFDTNCYHVIVQGIARESVFAGDALKSEYLNDIKKYKDDFNISVLAYCLLDNHAHFLIFAPNIELLGRFMRTVNTRFAQYYNHMCERIGYVFRDRYKSQAIFDSRYLTNCLVYIHQNPKKAGILKDYQNYPYSSYGEYVRGNGLIDLKKAGEYYDCSAANIEAIHNELTPAPEDCPEWIDCDDNKQQNKEQAVVKILGRLPLPAQYVKSDKALLKKTVGQLHDVGMSYEEIGEIFGLGKTSILRLNKE